MEILSTYSLTLLLIIIFAFMLSFTNITKHKYLFIFLITLLLSVLALFYDPITAFNKGNYTDLYRFYQTLDSIKGLPFNNNVVIFQEYNNIPVMKILLFLISRIGVNTLLPFISCFIFYGLFGIFLIKVCEKYNVSSRVLGLSFLIFICLFNFKMVISNIRCPIGSAIFMLTLYYDLLKNKKSKFYFLGYLVCCGIHPIFILFTVLRMLLMLSNRFTDKIFYLCIFIYNFFINYLLDFIGKFTGIELFEYLSMKIDFYMNSWDINSNEPLILFSGILQIIVLIYFMYIVKNKIKKKSAEENIYKVSIAFTLFTISSYWNFVIFQRCTWLLLFFLVYWYVYLKSLNLTKKNSTILVYDIVMLLLVIFYMTSYFLTYQYGVLTF